MPENEYPNVDAEFIIDRIQESDKIIKDSKFTVGSTTTFVLKGNKAFHKKFIVIRSIDGNVNFNQATGLAARFRFMGDLLKWFKVHRDWHEGAYISN